MISNYWTLWSCRVYSVTFSLSEKKNKQKKKKREKIKVTISELWRSFSRFQAVLVHTQETIRVRYFMDLLMVNRRPIMLVGSAGTGKTVLVGDKFAAMDPDNFMVTNVPFNYYTTSAMLQAVLDKPLEKKAGRNYGPPGTKKLIYFIDDMNMPMVSYLVHSQRAFARRTQIGNRIKRVISLKKNNNNNSNKQYFEEGLALEKSVVISLRWPIYRVSPADKTKHSSW